MGNTQNKMVKYLETVAEYEEALKSDKLVVIDFTAVWCPPCQMIGPKFEALANDTPDVMCYKVDVDKAADVSSKCGIQCMPTFQHYKNGAKIDELQGASEQQLKDKVAAHK